jgi:hypothetical protein
LPDESGDITLFEELPLGGQRVGGDRYQLAALEALGIAVDRRRPDGILISDLPVIKFK